MTTEDAARVLTDPDIDIVSVASYDNFHAEHVVAALENGKHVFVEKPLCMSRDEATRIRAVLSSHPNLKLSSNLSLRTCPRFCEAKRKIDEGDMGTVFLCQADYLWGRSQKLTEGWRNEMPFYSIIYGAAVHMVDLILWITGKRPIEVQAYGGRLASEGTTLRFNDLAVILLRFEDGMIGSVTASGMCVHPHFHNLSLYGTKATFDHGFNGAQLFTTSDPAVAPEPVAEVYPAREERSYVIETFVDSILDPDATLLVPTEDVFATMSVCLAAEEAVQTGRPVTVQYV